MKTPPVPIWSANALRSWLMAKPERLEPGLRPLGRTTSSSKEPWLALDPLGRLVVVRVAKSGHPPPLQKLAAELASFRQDSSKWARQVPHPEQARLLLVVSDLADDDRAGLALLADTLPLRVHGLEVHGKVEDPRPQLTLELPLRPFSTASLAENPGRSHLLRFFDGAARLRPPVMAWGDGDPILFHGRHGLCASLFCSVETPLFFARRPEGGVEEMEIHSSHDVDRALDGLMREQYEEMQAMA